MNYYELLGLDKNSSKADIKSAYKKLAKKYHPDVNLNKSDSEIKENSELFKKINDAYQILSDDKKRDQYDLKNSYKSYENIYNYGSYKDNRYSNNNTNYKNRFNPDASHNIINDVFLKEFKNQTYVHKYSSYDYDKNIKIDNNEVSIDIDILNHGKYCECTKSKDGMFFYKIQYSYDKSGNILYNKSGNLYINFYIPIPDHIEIIYNSNKGSFDIKHNTYISLYDLLFSDDIIVSNIIDKKYKLKIKNFKNINNIKCIIPNAGIKSSNDNPFNISSNTGNYIFNILINPVNIGNIEWKDLKLFKKFIKQISKDTEN